MRLSKNDNKESLRARFDLEIERYRSYYSDLTTIILAYSLLATLFIAIVTESFAPELRYYAIYAAMFMIIVAITAFRLFVIRSQGKNVKNAERIIKQMQTKKQT
jgi:succinyl-CoA synthetase beta subunit